MCTNTCKCKVLKDFRTPTSKMKQICKYCEVRYKNKEEYINHIKNVHGQPGTDLTASQRTLLLPCAGLLDDLEKDSDEETNEKTKYEETIVNKVQFTEELRNKYDFCDRRFPSRSQFKKHVVVHNKPVDEDRDRSFIEEATSEEVQCPICDIKELTGYMIHTRKVHAPPSKMNCELSDFMCNKKGEVRKHKTEKHSLKRPISEFCGNRFCDACGFHAQSRNSYKVHS